MDPLAGREEHIDAIRIARDLRGEERDRRDRALERSAPPPVPVVVPETVRRRADRQVSFRMSVRERSGRARRALGDDA